MQPCYKETPTQVFSCEYCEILKNTYFEEHIRTAASADGNDIDIYNLKSVCSLVFRCFAVFYKAGS